MDIAQEYVKLKKRCVDELGMECILTMKKAPEQNGVAERMMRTIEEIIRCALRRGKLPNALWAEVAVTSAFCVNLVPA